MNTAKDNVTKIRHTSVSEEVIDRILEMVENKVFKPGDMLPTEREFTEMFGVGRSSVREALRVLQSMDIIEKKTGNGTYLTSTPVASAKIFNKANIIEKFTVMDLSEARQVLEEQIVALAAKKASRENIDSMREANKQLSQMIGREPSEQIVECDFRVHQTIAEGAQNVFLSDMLDVLSNVLMKYNQAVLTKEKVEAAVEYHGQIIDKIARGDAQGAQKIMTEHIKDANERIVRDYCR